MMEQKTVLVLAGPTAVGKTAVAIRLAQLLRTEIISADSRQCFQELSVGVARPSSEELAAVPHHFIATHSVHQKVTAATFEQYALQKADELFRTSNVVVLTGGTGLYIKAFCEGLDNIPDTPLPVRNEIAEEYGAKGLAWLQEEVKAADPQFYATGEVQNPRRLMRALEVIRVTGNSILSYRVGEKRERPFRILKAALELPKEALHRNIHARVDKMMEEGLEKEVRNLQPLRHLNALQTVGYAELFQYMDGRLSREEAVERIKINTRQYAKRQMTWFRKDLSYTWFNAEEREVLPEKIARHFNLIP